MLPARVVRASGNARSPSLATGTGSRSVLWLRNGRSGAWAICYAWGGSPSFDAIPPPGRPLQQSLGRLNVCARAQRSPSAGLCRVVPEPIRSAVSRRQHQTHAEWLNGVLLRVVMWRSGELPVGRNWKAPTLDVDDGRPPLTMKDRPPALIPGGLLLERATSGEVTFAMCCAFIFAIDILWAPWSGALPAQPLRRPEGPRSGLT